MQARILVVDDEKFIVEAISQHLTTLGHEVLQFLDSREALQLINSEKVDLVLTDLKMPDVSGMDIAKAVAETGFDTRVIVLTGFATIDSAIESVELSVYAYLNKPFDLRDLGRVVNRALNEQKLERENETLHERIAKMLESMTTLHEVTRLLYDTENFDMTLDFALDTLSEGLGVTHSAFMFMNADGELNLSRSSFPEAAYISGRMDEVNWNDLPVHIPGPDPVTIAENGPLEHLLGTLSGPNEP